MAALISFSATSCNYTSKSNNQNDRNNIKSNIKKEKVMSVIQLNKEGFIKDVMDYEENPKEWKFKGDQPAIIDFYATWCGPCKMVAPIMEELADEYKGKVTFYKVDTEQEQELSALFGIRSIPSILFIPLNGQPQMSQGAMPKSSFKEAIDNILLKDSNKTSK
jgi:thioredoxin